MVLFSSGNKLFELPVQPEADLRSLQKQLCELFGQRFPKMMDAVRIGGEKFDDFGDKPFGDVQDGATVEVLFERTTDPFFYDLIDRTQRCGTIEEEILWETERVGGTTLLSYKEWLREQRRSLEAFAEIPLFAATAPAVVDVAFLPPWEELRRK